MFFSHEEIEQSLKDPFLNKEKKAAVHVRQKCKALIKECPHGDVSAEERLVTAATPLVAKVLYGEGRSKGSFYEGLWMAVELLKFADMCNCLRQERDEEPSFEQDMEELLVHIKTASAQAVLEEGGASLLESVYVNAFDEALPSFQKMLLPICMEQLPALCKADHEMAGYIVEALGLEASGWGEEMQNVFVTEFAQTLEPIVRIGCDCPSLLVSSFANAIKISEDALEGVHGFVGKTKSKLDSIYIGGIANFGEGPKDFFFAHVSKDLTGVSVGKKTVKVVGSGYSGEVIFEDTGTSCSFSGDEPYGAMNRMMSIGREIDVPVEEIPTFPKALLGRVKEAQNNTHP